MGHNTIDTTFAHYVSNGIRIMKARKAGEAVLAFPNLIDILKAKGEL
jgi:hypothetical protein